MTRLLALGILAIVLAVVATVVVLPLAALLDPDQSEAEHLLQRWATYDAVIQSRPALEDHLKKLRSDASAQAGTLKGDTTALAAASLQGDVKEIVERHGGQIRSARILPAQAVDAFEKVGVHYDVALPQPALERLLYDLEAHVPFLFVEAVDIRMPENWQPGQGGPQPSLAIRWQVIGYRWKGQP